MGTKYNYFININKKHMLKKDNKIHLPPEFNI